MSTWTVDRITAISAVVIAVATLAVSIWQGYETRRHQRLSVRPALVVDWNIPGRPDVAGASTFSFDATFTS